MATSERVMTVSLLQGADLRNNLYGALKLNASGQVVLAGGAAANATDEIIGVLAAEPTSGEVGQAVAVATVNGSGILKMKAGAAVTRNHVIVPHGVANTPAGRVAGVDGVSGRAANQIGVGYALEAASVGQIFRVLATVVAA